mmetsp:Transcript_6741/g.7587  ORF Transcript_6741/g.7587 Transcript_6741/m.7587 type:complete len:776 (-) Transcript_6741:138-2465(-)
MDSDRKELLASRVNDDVDVSNKSSDKRSKHNDSKSERKSKPRRKLKKEKRRNRRKRDHSSDDESGDNSSSYSSSSESESDRKASRRKRKKDRRRKRRNRRYNSDDDSSTPSSLDEDSGDILDDNSSTYNRKARKSKKEKRSKKKKKKKKPSSSDDTDSSPNNAGSMSIVYIENPIITPNRFVSTLEAFSQALLGFNDNNNETNNEPGELQQQACHASAGPLLIVLIRVLTYSASAESESATAAQKEDSMLKQKQKDSSKTKAKAKTIDNDNTDTTTTFGGALIPNPTNQPIADFRLGILKSEPRYTSGSLADRAVKRILCWQNDEKEQEHASDVIYGLSGEPRGSHVLETIMRLCPDEFYQSLLHYGNFIGAASSTNNNTDTDNDTAMQEYVAHNVSNFVIQTMLSTIRNQEQAKQVLTTIIRTVISNGIALDSSKKRRGILWRATELAAKYCLEEQQQEIVTAIHKGFLAITTTTTSGTARTSTNNSIKDWIPMLIGLRRPDAMDEQRITLDVPGCRSVFHLLQFSPRLCKDVLMGIIEGMSVEDLISITKDGLGSRCIMDGILDHQHGTTSSSIFGTATVDLRNKLSGQWASLATDRVGHHTVKKVFSALPRLDDKLKLVEELSSAGNRLHGNKMGRSVVDACCVDVFVDDGSNNTEWRQKVGRMAKKENFLTELIGGDRSTMNTATTTATTTTIDEGETITTTTTKTKAKRKRRRKRSTNTDTNNDDTTDVNVDNEDNNNNNETRKKKASKKSASSSGITMESIMNTINVGN